MKKIISIIMFAFVLFGCSSNVTVDDSLATPAGVENVVSANNQFAFDLYNKLSKDENVFFSPYSISAALAMTYEGARGQTADEMRSVLGFPVDDTSRRSSFARLFNIINKKDRSFKLHTANALWAEEEYKFLSQYLNIIEQFYGGKTTNLNFKSEPEKSRQVINDWVERQTNNRIKNLLSRGSVNSMTRLVLTNAIYFKGDWLKQFNEKQTMDEDFFAPESTVKVPMMRLTGKEASFNYAESDDFQVVKRIGVSAYPPVNRPGGITALKI